MWAMPPIIEPNGAMMENMRLVPGAVGCRCLMLFSDFLLNGVVVGGW
jgi:hypothetical protein